jgi:mRNA interferase HigB
VHAISYKAIREFAAVHADAGPVLNNWYRVTARCTWSNFAELKRVFESADWVSPYVVFNLVGNKYRLVAEINFRSQTLFIRHILTHRQYDQEGWKRS